MRRADGFTLIELVIVMVVVGILTAIAVPMYTSQIQKGRRASAKGVLQDIAGRQERYYTANSTYATTFAQLGMTSAPMATSNSYAISIAPDAAGIANSYVLTATLQTGFADPPCGNLTLRNTGAKGTTVLPGTGCW